MQLPVEFSITWVWYWHIGISIVLEVKWFTSVWQYLQHIGGSIGLDDLGMPPVQRVHDGYIMDMISACGQCKPA
jgi:hypothetical protein